MSTLETILVVVLVTIGTLAVLAMLAWWFLGRRGRALAQRIGALPVRGKAQLAGSLFGDPRLPTRARIGMALLVGYLALPIDIIPDFIPFFGQLDDIVMLVVGGALLMRSVPSGVIEEHLGRLEGEARDGVLG